MLANGTVIRGYTVLSLITSGGMGDIYEGIDQMLGRKVAIKAINPHLAHDPSFSKRFIAEGQAQASLNHPNIVSLYAMVEENGHYYMVMEYAEGITLKDQIQSCGPMPEARAVAIIAQVLGALELAHSKGIIHRDIKPSNIMIDAEDNVKILDFGVAKIMGDQGLTATGQNVGTISYMSPEQISSPKSVDHRTDIYSLGVSLYQLLTASLPYDTNTESDFMLMNDIVNKMPPDPRNYYPHISEQLVEIMFRMLAKNPEQRYSRCIDVQNDLLPLMDMNYSLSENEWMGATSVIQRAFPNLPTMNQGSSGSGSFSHNANHGSNYAGSNVSTQNSDAQQPGEFFIPQAKPMPPDLIQNMKNQQIVSIVALALLLGASSSAMGVLTVSILIGITFIRDKNKVIELPARIILGIVAVGYIFTNLVRVIEGASPSYGLIVSSMGAFALGLAQTYRAFQPRPRAYLTWIVVLCLVSIFAGGPHRNDIFYSDSSSLIGYSMLFALALLVLSMINLGKMAEFFVWEKVTVCILSFFPFVLPLIHRGTDEMTVFNFLTVLFASMIPIVVLLRTKKVQEYAVYLSTTAMAVMVALMKWQDNGRSWEEEITIFRFFVIIGIVISSQLFLGVSNKNLEKNLAWKAVYIVITIISVLLMLAVEDVLTSAVVLMIICQTVRVALAMLYKSKESGA